MNNTPFRWVHPFLESPGNVCCCLYLFVLCSPGISICDCWVWFWLCCQFLRCMCLRFLYYWCFFYLISSVAPCDICRPKYIGHIIGHAPNYDVKLRGFVSSGRFWDVIDIMSSCSDWSGFWLTGEPLQRLIKKVNCEWGASLKNKLIFFSVSLRILMDGSHITIISNKHPQKTENTYSEY